VVDGKGIATIRGLAWYKKKIPLEDEIDEVHSLGLGMNT
jgi:hypothetical protein